MSASPPWKVYRAGEYVGSLKYGEDAAALVSIAGGEVRYGHKLVVWREGEEEFLAGESYDKAAEIMNQRVNAAISASWKKALSSSLRRRAP